MPSATGSTRNVRRWIVWVAVLLLAGALINVAVAWGFALRPPVKKSDVPHLTGARSWHAWVPEDWPPPTQGEWLECAGYRGEAFLAGFDADPREAGPHTYWVHVASWGWPFRCMEWTHWQHNVPETNMGTMKGLPPRSSWWHWGMPIPEWMGPQPYFWRRFPVRPVPLPFLANSLFYAAALAAPVLGVAALWRRLRKKPGLCARCGYDLRDLPANAPCPECGAEAIGC